MRRFLYGLGILCCVLMIQAGGLEARSVTVTDAAGRSVEIGDTPGRIFSGGLNLDTILLRLVEAERIVAITRFSADPDFSFVSEKARQFETYPQVNPELVLSFRPDLVLLTPYMRAGIREKIESLGLPTLMTADMSELEDIVFNIRLIGEATGTADKARKLIGDMEDRLSELGECSLESSTPRILYYTPTGTVPGIKTLPDLIMRKAGIVNVAGESGIEGWKRLSDEQIFLTDPDWIVTDEPDLALVKRQLRSDALFSRMEAVKSNRIVGFKPRYLSVAGPDIVLSIKHWQEQFGIGCGE